MSVRIEQDENGQASEVSLQTINRKLESFVEIVLKKMVDQQQQIRELKAKVKKLEDEKRG